MSTPALEVRELHVAYGKVEALVGVGVQVSKGQIVTVLGPNGAGKTTLLMAVMRLLNSTGTIRIGAEGRTCRKPEEMVAAGVSLVPEKRELFGEMSIHDNLLLGAFSRRRMGVAERDRSLAEVFELFPRLSDRSAQMAATLSGGERQMLAIGRALMSRPTLLMLDEPSLGLAPLIVRDILRVVVELRTRGVSILLVEQNARAALQIADHGYVLEGGAITLEGPAADLAVNPRVIEAYLGLGGHQRNLVPV